MVIALHLRIRRQSYYKDAWLLIYLFHCPSVIKPESRCFIMLQPNDPMTIALQICTSFNSSNSREISSVELSSMKRVTRWTLLHSFQRLPLTTLVLRENHWLVFQNHLYYFICFRFMVPPSLFRWITIFRFSLLFNASISPQTVRSYSLVSFDYTALLLVTPHQSHFIVCSCGKPQRTLITFFPWIRQIFYCPL